jgi:hypothetical protein
MRRASRAAGLFVAPGPADLEGVTRRAIALVEMELEGEPNMLNMRELDPVDGDDAGGPFGALHDGDEVTRFRVAAAHFEDTVTFFPVLGHYEALAAHQPDCGRSPDSHSHGPVSDPGPLADHV